MPEVPEIHFVVVGTPRAPRAYTAPGYRQQVAREAARHFDTPLAERNIVLVIRHFYTSRNILDLDNLQKTVFDALKGVVYIDDSQIVRVTAERYNISPSYGVEDVTADEIEALDQGADFVSITVSTRD